MGHSVPDVDLRNGDQRAKHRIRTAEKEPEDKYNRRCEQYGAQCQGRPSAAQEHLRDELTLAKGREATGGDAAYPELERPAEIAHALSEDASHRRALSEGGAQKDQRTHHRAEVVEQELSAVSPCEASREKESGSQPSSLLASEPVVTLAGEVNGDAGEGDHPDEKANAETIVQKGIGQTAEEEAVEENAAGDRALLVLRPSSFGGGRNDGGCWVGERHEKAGKR